ncbi:cache domain-containing sensor histidine kinase [Caldanaerobius polysaccharolyticus]|uniref:cache domain-containing sensor histidine kinase n=1 Tax=Caldanaerobius polysaccharolyticus TaxID=44256 RepID=UPI00068BA795|nr:sensor histidine kinase [Caldanaerobius polysaccharolyticus]
MRDRVFEYIKSVFVNVFKEIKVRSMQFIITFSFALIAFMGMLFVGFVLYDKFLQVTEQDMIFNFRQVLEEVNLNFEYYIKDMIYISNTISNQLSVGEDFPNSKLLDQMNVILNSKDDIVTIAVFSDKGELLLATPFSKLKAGSNVQNQNWFNLALENFGNYYFSPPHVQDLFEGQRSWVISLSRGVTFERKGRRMNGVLLLDMNFRTIDRLCQMVNLGKRSYIYIIDSGGNMIYKPPQQLNHLELSRKNNMNFASHPDGSYLERINGEKRLVIVRTVAYTRWKIIGVSYMDELITTKKEVSRFIVFAVVLALFFVILSSVLIFKKIFRPMKRLEDCMKMIEKENFDVHLEVKGENEIAQLSRAFNLMVSKIKHLMSQIVLEEEQKRKSELSALQAQINPHFLYNTLDSIVWMAENGKMDEVIQMVTALARFFRISISKGKNIITVREELEYARSYLTIQKIRYKDKFRFEIQAQPEALECRTLKLILQPIIENSIYHGIENMVDEGFIKVSAQIVDNKLLYVVRDNGLGIKPEILKNILEYQTEGKRGSGIGIKNVHERIQLFFGKEYGLHIESELEVGTTVEIWLPIVKE